MSNIPQFGFVCCFFFPHDWTEIIWFRQERQEMCSQCIITMGFMMSICIIARDVWLDHLVKGVSASFLYSKVTIFPFVVNKCLGGDTLILSFAWMSWNSLRIELVVLLRDLIELHLMIMKWIPLRELSLSEIPAPYSWFHQRTFRLCRNKSFLVSIGLSYTHIPFIKKSPMLMLISYRSLNLLYPTVS